MSGHTPFRLPPIVKSLLIGLCVGVVTATLLLLVCALLIYKMDLPLSVATPLALVAIGIGGLLGGGAVGLPNQPAATHRHADVKRIPIQTGSIGGKPDAPPLVAVTAHTIPSAGPLYRWARIPPHRQGHGVAAPITGHTHPQGHSGMFRHRSKRRTVL